MHNLVNLLRQTLQFFLQVLSNVGHTRSTNRSALYDSPVVTFAATKTIKNINFLLFQFSQVQENGLYTNQ